MIYESAWYHKRSQIRGVLNPNKYHYFIKDEDYSLCGKVPSNLDLTLRNFSDIKPVCRCEECYKIKLAIQDENPHSFIRNLKSENLKKPVVAKEILVDEHHYHTINCGRCGQQCIFYSFKSTPDPNRQRVHIGCPKK